MVSKVLDGVRRRRAEVLLIFFMDVIYFFAYFQRVAIPGTIYDQLQTELSLKSSQVALLGAMYLYIYGGMQAFCGVAIDRVGAIKVILLGGALLSLGSVLFPLSHSIGILYTTRALVGLGASLIYLCLIKEIDVRFNAEYFSMLLCITILAGNAGGLFGTSPFERLVAAVPWRSALLGLGLICTISVFLTWYCDKKVPRPREHQISTSSLSALVHVLRNPTSYPVIITGSIVFGVYFVVQGIIGKKMLQDCCGMSSAQSAMYTFTMMLTAMGSAVVSGFVSAKIGNRRKALIIAASIATALAMALITLGLSNDAGRRWIGPCYMLLAMGSLGPPMFVCSMKELNKPDAAATSVGVYNSANYLSVGVFATLEGMALDRYASHALVTAHAIRYPAEAYRFVCLGMLALCLCAVMMSFLIKETHGKNVEEQRR